MSIELVGVKLARTPGLTGDHVQALLAQTGGDRERLCQPEVIAQVELPTAAREFLLRPDRTALEADLAWLRTSGARLVLWGDDDYPHALAAIRGAPPAFYLIGCVEALKAPQLAMVGARSASPLG